MPGVLPSSNPFDAPSGGIAAGNPFDTGGAVANPFDTPTATQPTGDTGMHSGPIIGFFQGLGHMAQGLTALGVSAVHDVAELGAHIIPGHQSIESDGYRLAAIGRAFIPSLASDYAKRYGGLSNIAHGLWNDPLSYISDALLVGGGVGALASAGRTGAILSKLPMVLSEDTATKILGAGADTAYKATLDLANPSLRAGVLDSMPLSSNPVTRLLQTKAADAFSIPAGKISQADFMAKMDNPEAVRAQTVIDYASQNGISVLKPSVGRFLAGRRTAYVLSKLKVVSQDVGQEAAGAITAVFDRADNPETAAAYLRGNATPITPGKYDPLPLDAVTTPNVPNATRLVPEGAVGPGTDIPFDLGHEFGTDWSVTNINTPHDPAHALEDAGKTGISHTYTVMTDSMDNAPAVAQRALEAAHLTPIGLRNYMLDETVAYDGYHVFGQAQDGAIADISIATKDLHEAQVANGHLIGYQSTLDSQRADLEQQLAAEVAKGTAAKPEDSVRIADELKAVEYNAQAADAFGRDMFRGHRLGYWADHGTSVDANLLSAEAARPVTFNAISSRWLSGGDGMGTYMERAYAEQRVFKFYGMLADSKGTIKNIMSSVGTGKADITDVLAKHLLDSGIPKDLVTEMMGSRQWWSGDAATAAKRADRFVQRMSTTLHDYMVKEGGRGLELGFPQYDWRVMRQARLDAGMPVTSYFPHFPEARPSASLTRTSGLVTRSPGITKGWKGMLVESGNVLNDPVEAYSRAAAIMVQHEEAAQALDKLMADVGRELSPQEVIDWQGNNYAGEQMVPLEHTKGLLSRRAEIMGDTLNGVAQGKDLTNATLDAAHMLQERALTEGINGIGGSRVFAVSRAVMRQFEKDLKVRFGQAMRIGYDGPMNLWKGSVLSLSPRWLVNNFFGNQFFMGLENPGALRLALEQMDKTTAHITDQLFGAWSTENKQGFFSDAQKMSVIPEDTTSAILKAAKRVQDSPAGHALSTASGKVRRLNQWIEQSARRGTLVNEVRKRALTGWVQGFHSSESILKRALSEGDITPELMGQALKGVNKTLGDYTHFGVYEQGILKRFLVPFWAFYRHSGKVLLRLPFEHPLKAEVLRNIANVDQQMSVGEPDWLRSRFTLGMLGGKNLMLNMQNLNPLSNFSDQFTQGQSIVSTLNPLVKMVLERQLGVDTYTGQPFQTPDNVVQTWDGSFYQILTDSSGAYAGVRLMHGKPLPSLLNHLASQFPQLAVFPSFQRYPKSVLLQIASMFGAPLSQIDVAGTDARYAQSAADAARTAQNRLGSSTNPFDAAAA